MSDTQHTHIASSLILRKTVTDTRETLVVHAINVAVYFLQFKRVARSVCGKQHADSKSMVSMMGIYGLWSTATTTKAVDDF